MTLDRKVRKSSRSKERKKKLQLRTSIQFQKSVSNFRYSPARALQRSYTTFYKKNSYSSGRSICPRRAEAAKSGLHCQPGVLPDETFRWFTFSNFVTFFLLIQRSAW